MFRSRDIKIFVFLWNLLISKVLLHNASYTYAYCFWIISPIKIKFGQILLCCMTNIYNIILAECWWLETSSRLFYDFIKMTIAQDLAIFNGSHIPFLIVLYPPFQKNETLESWRIWLLSNWGRLLIWKGPGILPQYTKLFKRLLKIIALAYIYQLATFGDFMICGSKNIFKNAPYFMY